MTKLRYNADFGHMGRFQQKQPIGGEISKILARDPKIFCPRKIFMFMNLKFLKEHCVSFQPPLCKGRGKIMGEDFFLNSGERLRAGGGEGWPERHDLIFCVISVRGLMQDGQFSLAKIFPAIFPSNVENFSKKNKLTRQ